MNMILSVAAGGAAGAVLRWLLATRINAWLFPWGTFMVNVLGSFAIGLCWVWMEHRGVSEVLKAGVLVGVLGGFTTFSAFSLETLHLVERGEAKSALLYALASLIICVLAAAAGLGVGRSLYT